MHEDLNTCPTPVLVSFGNKTTNLRWIFAVVAYQLTSFQLCLHENPKVSRSSCDHAQSLQHAKDLHLEHVLRSGPIIIQIQIIRSFQILTQASRTNNKWVKNGKKTLSKIHKKKTTNREASVAFLLIWNERAWPLGPLEPLNNRKDLPKLLHLGRQTQTGNSTQVQSLCEISNSPIMKPALEIMSTIYSEHRVQQHNLYTL